MSKNNVFSGMDKEFSSIYLGAWKSFFFVIKEEFF